MLTLWEGLFFDVRESLAAFGGSTFMHPPGVCCRSVRAGRSVQDGRRRWQRSGAGFLQHCILYTLDSSRQGVGESADTWKPPSDPSPALAALQSQFPGDILVESAWP